MKYSTFTVGDKDYKLRLPGSSIVTVEKKLGGKNLLSVLMDMESGTLPTINDIMLILHAAIQKFHHGISMENMLEIYDEYVDEGKTYMDLIPVLMEVLKVSGFFNAGMVPVMTAPVSQ